MLELIVVSHTHWDREWYLPFQAFRLKLVDLIDEVLAILEHQPEYRYFMLDGQTAVLEDYLEALPERRAELGRHIREGRLLVGPWYILSDEFLVSAEALIRNLQSGLQMAGEFGEPMRVGYLPDPFGHISAMPKILRGFGIDTAVLWRGVGEDMQRSEFLWRSDDGSQVLTLYLPHAYFNAHRLPEEPEAFLSAIAYIRSRLEPWATTPYLLLMNGSDHAFPEKTLPEMIAHANERLTDCRMVHGNLPMILEGVRRYAADNRVSWPVAEGELRDSKRAHLLPGVLSTRMSIKQRNAAAEGFLEKWAEPFGAWASLIGAGSPGAIRDELRLAWRYLLQNQPHDSICGCSVDQVHDEMRTRFDWSQQIAEDITERALAGLAAQVNTEGPVDGAVPVIVFNPVAGPRTDFVTCRLPSSNAFAIQDSAGRTCPHQVLRRFPSEDRPMEGLDVAREGLLALLTAVTQDNTEHWSVEKLASVVEALSRIGGPLLSNVALVDMHIFPAVREGCIVVELVSDPERVPHWDHLEEVLGQLVALARDENTRLFQLRVRRPDEIEVGFVARDVPGHGYRTYWLVPPQQIEVEEVEAIQKNHIDNEFFSIEASPADGTLTIVDKESGRTLKGLSRFVDGGDCGDEYTFAAPSQDTLVGGPSTAPQIRLIEEGAARHTLRIDLSYRLPACLTSDRRARSTEAVECPIVTYVSLYPGVRRVDVRTEVDNLAEDHRLRVHFPAGVRAEHSYAEGHFGVVMRSTAVPTGGPEWAEDPIGTCPQKTFVDVNDGERGLLLANRGLPEYEVLSEEDGSAIALTLLRCVGWLSRDDLPNRRGHAGPPLPTPGAQCIGHYTFEYALVPHEGTWETVFIQAQAFDSPLRAVAAGLHPGPLPWDGAVVEVQPSSLVGSAVKLPEEGEGLIVRLYNISNSEVAGSIRVAPPGLHPHPGPVPEGGGTFSRAMLVDLQENSLEELNMEAGRVGLQVRPGQIVTIRFQ